MLFGRHNKKINKELKLLRERLDDLTLVEKYTVLQDYEKDEETGLVNDEAFIYDISNIANNEHFKYMLYDLRELFITKMYDADIEASKQLLGMIKAIDKLTVMLRNYTIKQADIDRKSTIS